MENNIPHIYGRNNLYWYGGGILRMICVFHLLPDDFDLNLITIPLGLTEWSIRESWGGLCLIYFPC